MTECVHRWHEITDTFRLRNSAARLCGDETNGEGRIIRAKACEFCGCNVALERCNVSGCQKHPICREA